MGRGGESGTTWDNESESKPCFKAGRLNVTCGVIALAIFGTVSMLTSIPLFALSSPREMTIFDIKDKMKPSEGASGGSSYIKGGAGTGLHIYVDEEEMGTVETSDNSVGTKVTVHEYIHLLQQAFLNGDSTSTEGPVALRSDATSSERFHVIFACDFQNKDIYGDLHLAALNAMPDDYKLLDVPTYVILYPSDYATESFGCVDMSDEQVTTRANEIYEEIYGTSPGENPWMGNENHAFAEGAAEYYALQMSGVWSTFNGPAAWNEKLREDLEMCSLPDGSDASLLKIESGSSEDCEKVVKSYEDAGRESCADNPIGEVTYSAFLDYCATEGFSCSHKDLMKVWIQSGITHEEGWCDSFQASYGKSWGDFVCYMENKYGVSSDCIPADIPCMDYSPATLSEFYAIAVAFIILGAVLCMCMCSYMFYKRDPAADSPPVHIDAQGRTMTKDYELAATTTEKTDV